MALETITSGAASTVADLDPNSPGNGEDVGQGDDHLRNIKYAIQLTWPNLSATCSGVAAEFAFAHKGGTVSGSAVFKGDVHVEGTLSVSGTIIGAGAVVGTLDVSATISGSAKEAAFARSASFAYSTVHALSANTSLSANRAGSASRALNCSSANYAASAGFAASLSGQGALAKLDSVSATEIDAGAVGQSEVASSAVGQAELKSTTADHNYTSDPQDYLQLTGGQYVLGVQFGATGGTGTDGLAVGWGSRNYDTNAGSYLSSDPAAGGTNPLIGGDYIDNFGSRGTYRNLIALDVSGNDTAKIRERYIQSSPPYDLGDGEVYGFIFAQMKPGGTIAAFSIMEDPPWYNNGPTDCSPDKYYYNKDKTQKTPVKLITRVDGLCWLDVRDDEQKKAHYLKMRAQGRNITQDYEPISQAIKNADMEIIPTNWVRPNRNNTLVMLDPMSEVTRRVMEMKQEGIDVFEELFFKDYMKIDNTPLKRCCPSKLMAADCRFK